MKAIDTLPRSPGTNWTCEEVKITGNIKGEDGQMLEENVELWLRNPLECIRELLGNPAFRECMKYAPERHYADRGLSKRMFSEMWTGDWWWTVQVRTRTHWMFDWTDLRTKGKTSEGGYSHPRHTSIR